MELFDDAAMDQLQAALGRLGTGSLALEIEGLESPRQLVRLTLQGGRELDWTFDEAWQAAMNRLQPSQAGGSIDPIAAAELREDRQLIEEDKSYYRAYFEGREPTTLERAQQLVAATARLEADEAAARMRQIPTTQIPARSMRAAA